MNSLKTITSATLIVLCIGLSSFAFGETAGVSPEKPWDDAVYYVESPDILTVTFSKSIQCFAGKNEILHENMSVRLITLDVDHHLVSHDFPIGPGGVIDLRELVQKKTARIVIGDLTLGEAEELIQPYFPDSQRVILSIVSNLNQNGNHLVSPDGYVLLDQKRVYVNGLTVKEIAEAIELAFPACEKGSVSVSIYAYNSKEYYVIIPGTGAQVGPEGVPETVFSFPCTGSETILKAIANVNGLTPSFSSSFSSKRIWIARPVGNANAPLILPVDWNAVVNGVAAANHRILPNDRIFIDLSTK